MCRVEWPGSDAPALWGGAYGTAKVVAGTEPLAVTSDGVVHKL